MMRFAAQKQKQSGNHKYSKMNSRTMKLQSLSAIYAREHSPAVFEEMKE